MKYKILCTDGLSKAGQDEISTSENLDVVFKESMTHDELLGEIADYDGLVVRSASTVSRDVIEAGSRLKLIARAGVGTDNIDLAAATKSGIFVINAPSGNTISAAELSFAMILSLARNIPQAARSMAEGKWEKKKFKGAELANKTLGVIGLGKIGQEVASRARAFRMKVLAFDPNLSDEQVEDMGVGASTLEGIYRAADFITIHTPLTKDTENLITKKEIAMMKPNAKIVNCARGGIINEGDLAVALKEKKIAGAALDVFTTEPFDSPIFSGVDNCIMTPHLGASTAEAQDAVAREVGISVSRFFNEGIMPSVVNLPQARGDAVIEHGRHIELAEKLGHIAAQLLGDRIEGVTFYATYSCPALLSIAAFEGALAENFDERITLVNAMQVAKEKGISVMEEIVDASKDFSDSIGVKVKSDTNELTVWGAVLDDGSLRVSRCYDYRCEIDPRGKILFVHNLDKPGMIGTICSLLGQYSINIAEMQNVRKRAGDVALTLIGIDGDISDECIKRISDEDGISEVRLVSL